MSDSTNLSKQHRDELLNIVSKLREGTPVDAIEINKLESFIKSRKYGLIFEQHEEEVDRLLRDHIPYFEDIASRTLSTPTTTDCNFLLEGDNLHSLKLLEKTHKGKIDVIYIDPPYNTGNKDFIYADKMIGTDDGFRHSKWLSFMSERLEIARRLLSEQGVIFISIDDNEQAQLKLLCDDIFGEENFVCNFIRKTSSGEKTAKPKINKHHEQCYLYAKSINKLIEMDLLKGKEKDFEGYSNPDNDPNGNWKKDSYLIKIDGGRYGYARYGITNPYLNITQYPPVYYNEKDRKQWHYIESTFNEMVKRGQVVFYKTKEEMGNNQYAFYIKKYQSSIGDKYSNISSLLYTDNGFTNSDGTKVLKDIFKNSYNLMGMYPKPVSFIKGLIKSIDNSSSLILDFFAGSGTTGHAVLELNKEDGGHRKFILCTNNENNICEDITYQRLKTVITGKRKDGTTYSDPIPANLKYFKVAATPTEDEYLWYTLLNNCETLIQLENMSTLNSDEFKVIWGDEDMDKLMALSEEKLRLIKKIYMSKEDIALSGEQSAFIERLTLRGAQWIDIPTAYYKEVK